MSVENRVRLLAGSLVLIGVVLSLVVNPWWLILTAFVGANLVQSAFTNVCPAAAIFKKLDQRSAHHHGAA